MFSCLEQRRLFGGRQTSKAVFIFADGGLSLSPQKSENQDLVEIYDVSYMEHHSSGLFSQAGFLFLAVVGGADYLVRAKLSE
jgi:hypothetical protein